jgi:DnaJ-class molecular chaperone
VRVITPTKLTRDQRAILQQLDQMLKVENRPADRNSSFFEKVKDIFG